MRFKNTFRSRIPTNRVHLRFIGSIVCLFVDLGYFWLARLYFPFLSICSFQLGNGTKENDKNCESKRVAVTVRKAKITLRQEFDECSAISIKLSVLLSVSE